MGTFFSRIVAILTGGISLEVGWRRERPLMRHYAVKSTKKQDW
jgi:hypothetical protein